MLGEHSPELDTRPLFLVLGNFAYLKSPMLPVTEEFNLVTSPSNVSTLLIYSGLNYNYSGGARISLHER